MFLLTLNELFISIEGAGPPCCTHYVYTKAQSGQTNTSKQSAFYIFQVISVFNSHYLATGGVLSWLQCIASQLDATKS